MNEFALVSAVLLTAIFMAIVIDIIYELNHFVIKSYTISTDKFKDGFQGINIVLLADLHNNIYGKDNEKLLIAIDKINPDAVFIAGDMLVGKLKQDYSHTVAFIKNLCRKYTVYYGNGNHEYRLKMYPENYGIIYDDYFGDIRDSDRKGNFHHLMNDHCMMRKTAGNICIYGVEIDKEYYQKLHRPKMDKDYLRRSLGMPDQERFNILIAHNPEFFERYVQWGADLILSGHNHGGIVRLPLIGGVISAGFRLFPKYDIGLFSMGKCKMILSGGLGMHTIKIRFLNRPELVHIHIKNEQKGMA